MLQESSLKMKKSQTTAARRRVNLPRISTLIVVFGSLVAFPSLADAQLETARRLENGRLFVRAQVPVVVPIGVTSNAGAGFTPAVAVALDDHLSLEVLSGVLYYRHDDVDQLNVPVLAGFTINLAPGARFSPTLSAKLGYTYAPDAAESHHLLTACLGAGALVRLSADIDLDLGIQLLAPDLKAEAAAELGLIFRLGIRYRLF
jgi:hypothetical protein